MNNLFGPHKLKNSSLCYGTMQFGDGANEKDSQDLVYQTFFGSIELLLKNNNSALKLAQNIAVSGGTTEAAFKIFLDKKILHKTFEKAINAAYKKSIKLSK